MDIYAYTDKTSQIYKQYPKLFDSYFGIKKSITTGIHKKPDSPDNYTTMSDIEEIMR